MYCIDNMTDKLNHNSQPELSEHDAELLSAYIDEMLSVDEERELEARLLKDAFLRDELAAMRQTVLWMNALPTLKAPRDFTISVEDVALAEKASGRKVIPMQNRNTWYLASAAAIVIVIVGIAVILPSLSMSPASDNTAESIAFSATERILPTNDVQAQAQTLDIADNDASDDTALFGADGESDSDFAEESAEMDDSSSGLNNTANVQAETVADTVSATNIALAVVQTTATALSDLFSTTATPQATQDANFAVPTATPFAIGQGGGGASIADSPAPVSVMAEAETTVETNDSDVDSLNTGGTTNLAAEAPVAPQDESQEPDLAANSADPNRSGIESRSAEPEPSNLIQAVINAMRNYVESKRS